MTAPIADDPLTTADAMWRAFIMDLVEESPLMELPIDDADIPDDLATVAFTFPVQFVLGAHSIIEHCAMENNIARTDFVIDIWQVLRPSTLGTCYGLALHRTTP